MISVSEHSACIGLGSNLGDKIANIQTAIEALDVSFGCRVERVSSMWESKPVGITDQPDFVNAVVRLSTTLTPNDLLEVCLNTEKQMGRVREVRWGPRNIDIDILLYDNLSIAAEKLTLPHPRMLERAFVMLPLAEIDPEISLSGGVTVRQAVKQLPYEGAVRITEHAWSRKW
jgi:2-amino-4-hydroxy-6-hydroxymethyldihydropteridine diphosphokinase